MKRLAKLPLALLLGAALVSHIASAQDIDTLRKIKDSGVIRIGSRDSSIPFSYVAKGGTDPIGFSNDICLKIVDAVKAKLGLPALRVEYTTLTSLNRMPLMQNGTVDLDCATTTNSVARQQLVAFAPSHFVAGITVAVKKDSGINSLADLTGKTVATVAGSTSIQLLRGARKNGNSAAMAGVMHLVDEADIKVLADYISKLKP